MCGCVKSSGREFINKLIDGRHRLLNIKTKTHYPKKLEFINNLIWVIDQQIESTESNNDQVLCELIERVLPQLNDKHSFDMVGGLLD